MGPLGGSSRYRSGDLLGTYNVYSVMLGGTEKLKDWEPYDTLQFAIVESQHHM